MDINNFDVGDTPAENRKYTKMNELPGGQWDDRFHHEIQGFAKLEDARDKNLTIGWGFNLDGHISQRVFAEMGIPMWSGDGDGTLWLRAEDPDKRYRLSSAEQDEAFKRHYDIHAKVAETVYSKSYGVKNMIPWNNQPQRIKGIATDLAYNTKNPESFTGFWKALQEGNYQKAANELKFMDPTAPTKQETPYWKALKGDKNITGRAQRQFNSLNRKTAKKLPVPITLKQIPYENMPDELTDYDTIEQQTLEEFAFIQSVRRLSNLVSHQTTTR